MATSSGRARANRLETGEGLNWQEFATGAERLKDKKKKKKNPKDSGLDHKNKGEVHFEAKWWVFMKHLYEPAQQQLEDTFSSF